MAVLIACEESQRVTIEFRKLGIEAFSCDTMECSGERPEWHIKGDVLEQLNKDWDMMLAFPPCTYLTNAGLRWFDENKYGDKARERKINRLKAFDFVMKLWNSNIPKIMIENPVGYLNTYFRKPDQIIQPWQFGVTESKRTCLWLKNLSVLKHTKIVKPKIYGYFGKGRRKGKPIYWHEHNSFIPNRSVIRSKTFVGIAKAMASTWSKEL